jgi:hypothetical protein
MCSRVVIGITFVFSNRDGGGIRDSAQGDEGDSLGRRESATSAFGAGDGTRTRDLELGKLRLYQLSYARSFEALRILRYDPNCVSN